MPIENPFCAEISIIPAKNNKMEMIKVLFMVFSFNAGQTYEEFLEKTANYYLVSVVIFSLR